MRYMRAMFSFLLALLFIEASAQDLTGIWRGHFKSTNYSRLLDSLGLEDRYKFETQITQNNKQFEGVTYSYRTTVFYGKASCIGTVSSKTKKVILGENKLLEVKSADGGACLMTCFLQYTKVGNEEFLEGTYTSISVRDSTQCGGGTVYLRKVPNSDFYKEPFLVEAEKSKAAPPTARVPAPENKAPQQQSGDKKSPPVSKSTPPKTNPQKQTAKPAAPPNVKKPVTAKSKNTTSNSQKKPVPPAVAKKNEIKTITTDTVKHEIPKVSAPVPIPRVLATRKNELVKTISSSANEISIKIYDNGTIDNDTVSVYLDNKLVLSRQRLTEQPLTLKINLDDDQPYHELVMVAENLGEIPPNTSLMVVDAGDEQHEVRITSTEQKNAVVRFTKK
jgi:hypothetical protein